MSGVALACRDLRLVRPRGGFTLEVEALELRRGGVLAILGPNGAGKSTLLRTLAGLERIDAGGVETHEASVVTMVFQRPAAFSGSVAHNVRAALYGSGLGGEETTRRVRAALDRFAIAGLADRRAATLSGGELRRLALARAFVLEPSVLLLDEPFDDLDAAGQEALSLDLRRVIDATDVAVAMVTHDLRRALLLADRIAVLREGRVAQQGPCDELLDHPASCEVAQLLGMTNLIPGRTSRDGRTVEVGPESRIPLAAAVRPDAAVFAGIRPEDLKVDVGRGEGEAIGKAVVTHVVSDGLTVTLGVSWSGVELRTVLLAGRGLGRTLRPGDRVSLSVAPDRVHTLPRDAGSE